MKTVIINGSPRKKGNTALLLKEAEKGAVSKNNETKFINLYSLNFKGCISCFQCKRLGSKTYGKCSVKDDLAPVLAEIEESEHIILGSPIYLGNITGVMQQFLERFIFQYLIYDKNYTSLAPKKLKTSFIFTMNLTEKLAKNSGYFEIINSKIFLLERAFGKCTSLLSTNTYQFDDYSKYETSGIDLISKIHHKEKEFPKDCVKSFILGSQI